jgi:hypothetical protein
MLRTVRRNEMVIVVCSFVQLLFSMLVGVTYEISLLHGYPPNKMIPILASTLGAFAVVAIIAVGVMSAFTPEPAAPPDRVPPGGLFLI